LAGLEPVEACFHPVKAGAVVCTQIAQGGSILLSHEIETRFKAAPYRYDQAS